MIYLAEFTAYYASIVLSPLDLLAFLIGVVIIFFCFGYFICHYALSS